MRPPSPSLSSPHPELLSFIRNNPSSAPKPLLSLTDIHNTRAFIRLFNSVLKDTSSNNPVSYKIQDIQVPARDGALLPGRVYTPKKTRTKTGMPGLYICHGGGYVIGELAGQEWIAEVWCKLGGVVVDILYRHAPETKWPGAVDDAVDGWGWVSTLTFRSFCVFLGLAVSGGRTASATTGLLTSSVGGERVRENADENRCSRIWESWE